MLFAGSESDMDGECSHGNVDPGGIPVGSQWTHYRGK